MRRAPEAALIVALSTFALTGVVAMELDRLDTRASAPPVDWAPPDPALIDGAAWFAGVRPFCNALDVETRVRAEPPPASPDGLTYQAACYALAGRLDRARRLIDLLPKDLRRPAAAIVFDVLAEYPVADVERARALEMFASMRSREIR